MNGFASWKLQPLPSQMGGGVGAGSGRTRARDPLHSSGREVSWWVKSQQWRAVLLEATKPQTQRLNTINNINNTFDEESRIWRIEKTTGVTLCLFIILKSLFLLIIMMQSFYLWGVPDLVTSTTSSSPGSSSTQAPNSRSPSFDLLLCKLETSSW